MQATEVADCATIIKAFQKHLLSAPSEEAIIGSLTASVAGIQVNAASAASNLRNLSDPPIPNEVLGAFSASANSSGAELSISLPDTNKSTDPANWQEWLKDCIPCDLRLQFRVELASNIDDEILKALEAMLASFLQQLDFILNMLNATDVYGDVCPLLFSIQDICIPDLQRILSLLASILYRMTVRELNATDLMKLLIMPIFQPIFQALLGLLNQYKILVTDPLTCVEANLVTQLNKLKIGSVFNETLANDLTDKANAIGLVSGVAQTQDLRKKMQDARQPFKNLDQGITALQDASGQAAFHLHRLMNLGIAEIESLLDDLKREINKFIKDNNIETSEFLLNQYQKLIIFRLIAFISALVKALTIGFNCDFNNPAKAQDTVSKFLNDFLGPNAPIIVTSDKDGRIQLITNPDLQIPIRDIIKSNPSVITVTLGINSPNILTPSGNPEVDKTFDAIISKTNQPVSVKPECVFEPSSADGNKLAEWIRELKQTGE